MVTHPRTLVSDAGSPWEACPSSQTFQRVAAPAGGFGQLVMRIVVRTRMMMVEFITILVKVKMVIMVKMVVVMMLCSHLYVIFFGGSTISFLVFATGSLPDL